MNSTNSNYINFEFTADYNKDIKEYVKTISKDAELTQERRIEVYDTLIEDYIKVVGARPNGAILSRITNSILNEDLSSKKTNKRTATEYPILSINQIKRKLKQEPLLSEAELLDLYASDKKFYIDGKKSDKNYMEMSKEEQEAVADFFRRNAKQNGLNTKKEE
jgi:hypothetical protein